MGEARRRRETIRQRLENCPFCIYCGGATPTETTEHMPPIGLFRGRHRPRGLEFPCCSDCNQGTRLADAVAGLLSRVFPEPVSDQERLDIRNALRGVGNNIPGLLEEMRIGRGGQKLARKGLPNWFDHPEVGFARVHGPILSGYMWTFAAKMGLALHFECTGQAVPCHGAICPGWFSNVQYLRGEMPPELLDAFPDRKTLRQGRKQVTDQFEYAHAVADDGSMWLHFATFRQSFAVACYTADRAAELATLTGGDWPVISPPCFDATKAPAFG